MLTPKTASPISGKQHAKDRLEIVKWLREAKIAVSKKSCDAHWAVMENRIPWPEVSDYLNESWQKRAAMWANYGDQFKLVRRISRPRIRVRGALMS